MNFLDSVQARAAASHRKIVFAEASDSRTQAAVAELARRKIVEPVVVLDPADPTSHDNVRALGVEVRDPSSDPLTEIAINRLLSERRERGLTKESASTIVHTPLYFRRS